MQVLRLGNGSQRQHRYAHPFNVSLAHGFNITYMIAELYYLYGCAQTTHARERPAAPNFTRAYDELCSLQGEQRLGRAKPYGLLVHNPHKFTVASYILTPRLLRLQVNNAEWDGSVR